MHHRREIDGLRAVAVLPVILFHAGFAGLPGGYAGVDVFFVISGYLIAGILLADLDAGRFSLAAFYERRARRILPALFAMLAVVTPLAWWVLLPDQFRDYGESLAAVVLFLSNLYFLSQVDYFAPAAEVQPLLHAWSLAVEEQYYLLFPLALRVLWRGGPRRMLGWLAAAGAASFVLAVWAVGQDAERAFFFTLTRVWELLAGAVCAVLDRRAPGRPCDLRAGGGLALILLAFVAFDGAAGYPGWPALLPVIGTALVLRHARAGTRVAGILSLRGPVALGLVSYSAYLWHQPVLALARVQAGGEPPAPVMAGLVLLCLGLAALSWALVEQPFRRRPAPVIATRRGVFGASFAASAALVALGVIAARGGVPERAWRAVHPDLARIADTVRRAETEALPDDDGACRFLTDEVTPEIAARLAACRDRFGPGVAVLGDSHAIDLFGIIASRGNRPFVAGIAEPACRPAEPRPGCPYGDFARLVGDAPGLFEVVIFEQSGAYLLDPGGEVPAQVRMMNLPAGEAVPGWPVDGARLAATVAALADLGRIAPVVWMGPRIEPQVPLVALVRRGCERGLSLRPGTEALFDRLDSTVAEAARQAGIPYLSQGAVLGLAFPRDFGGCEGLLWADGDHFSALGERRMGARADVAAAVLAALR